LCDFFSGELGLKINLALWDRLLRYFVGFFALFWAVAGGPWWAYFGVYLIISASWGFCIFYPMLGIASFRDVYELKRRKIF
jgi:hypothetical protein